MRPLDIRITCANCGHDTAISISLPRSSAPAERGPTKTTQRIQEFLATIPGGATDLEIMEGLGWSSRGSLNDELRQMLNRQELVRTTARPARYLLPTAPEASSN